MKITDEREDNKKPFSDFNSGDVFEYEGRKYMKTHEIHGDYDANAVSLHSGSHEFIDADELVTPLLDTELIIRG